MRLTDYERNAQRDIDRWERGAGDNLLTQALGFVMRPVDWIFDQFVPDSVVDALTDALNVVLGTLNDASEWTYDSDDLLKKAHEMEIVGMKRCKDSPILRVLLGFDSENKTKGA